MPRAPPTSLLGSLVALPTPALSSGIESITIVVEGAIVRPMPSPSMKKVNAILRYSVPTSTVVNSNIPVQTKVRPMATTLLFPNFATNLSLLAAAGINPNGKGINRSAADKAEWPLTS